MSICEEIAYLPLYSLSNVTFRIWLKGTLS